MHGLLHGTPRRLERVADFVDPRGAGGAQHGAKHRREHVRVLMRVDVGERETAILSSAICAAASASISAGSMRPVSRRGKNAESVV